MTRIILASASPRRRALLRALGLQFDVAPADVPETLDGDPSELVLLNARAKRDAVAPRIEGAALVIAADTVVVLNGHVLGKPADLDEAQRMVSALAGKTHRVITGLAICDTANGRHADGIETTAVTFRALEPAEVRRFVEAVRPTDRAGAYTVDGPGSLLVASYEGCYQNVLGLPVVRLDLLLRTIGYSLFDLMNASESVFL